MIKIISRTLLSMMACTLVLGAVVADEPKHFDPKGKMPSKYTREFQVDAATDSATGGQERFRGTVTGLYCRAGLYPDHGRCRQCCLGYGAL